jgi:hypothetical protein
VARIQHRGPFLLVVFIDELRETLVEGGVAELISLLKSEFPDDAVRR